MSKLAVLAGLIATSCVLVACSSSVAGIECVAATDCGGYAECIDGTCKTACIDRYSCASGETCESGYCVPCGAACDGNGSDGGGSGDTDLPAGDTAGDNNAAPADGNLPGDTTNGDTNIGDSNTGDSRPPDDVGGCGLTLHDCGGACIPLADCCETETPEATCDDNVDNDCDGLTDCDDPIDCPDTTSCGASGQECLGGVCVCTIPASPEMICDDSVDNDCDGLIDCDDSDCDTRTCAPHDCDPPTACTGFTDACDEIGTLDVTCTDYLCNSGVCTPSPPVTTPQNCGRTTDGMSCDDGLFCTQTDTCSGGSCIGTGDPCPGADGDGNCSETCDETTDGCDGSDTAGTPCGGSAADCDALDTCDGNGGCTDNVDPASTICRAEAGACDTPEYCTGSSNACPGDSHEPGGTSCGGSSADCDALDTCDGNGGCIDNVDPAGTVCQGKGASPTCDPADTCNGSAKSCPVNYAADNTSCDSGTTCGGLCQSGSCDAIPETEATFYADCWGCGGFDGDDGGSGYQRVEAAHFSGYDWSCNYVEEPTSTRGFWAFDTRPLPDGTTIIWAQIRGYRIGGPGWQSGPLYKTWFDPPLPAGSYYSPIGAEVATLPNGAGGWIPWTNITASSVETAAWSAYSIRWPWTESCGWSGARYSTNPGEEAELLVRYCNP